ncbi:hypothetical protein CEP53_013159 [Fusarium sp. AF-6]|nr:hypothetical protein CEP53_013159 [Fusarium sp. AF-6]
MRLFVLTGFVLLPHLVVAQIARRYEALPIAQGDLIPRFFLDQAFPLAKRDKDCGEGYHNCLDIGFGDDCCTNDQYCYVNKDGDPKCCQIGSNCASENLCSKDATRQYFCTRTVTQSGTAATQEGCCDRKCPRTSLYLCPSDLGGNCCGFGSECRPDGKCASTKSASQTGLLTPIPSGCTTSQFKCADGAGCCDDGQVCTQVSGEGYCAEARPTGSDIRVVDDDEDGGGELSDGAKAGIGVGAVVGASIIIGGFTWMCLAKRRRRRETTTGESRTAGEGDEVTSTVRDGMTDISGSQARHGLTRDYFGPDAVAGPYTDSAISPTTAASPGMGRAVPIQAHGPGDIAAPVEIDSTAREGSSFLSPMSSPSLDHTPGSETIHGRFELYGNDEPIAPPRPLSIVPTPRQTPRQTPEPEDKPRKSHDADSQDKK